MCEMAVFCLACSAKILKEAPDAILIAGDLYAGAAIDTPKNETQNHWCAASGRARKSGFALFRLLTPKQLAYL